MMPNEYYAIMNLLGTLGFSQDKINHTKFYLHMEGDIHAQIVDEPDEQVKFCNNLEVILKPNIIEVNYQKYAALENGRLVWVPCKSSSIYQIDELISTITAALSEVYGSCAYEFNNIGNYGYSSIIVTDTVKDTFEG